MNLKHKTRNASTALKDILAKRLLGPIRLGYVVFLLAVVMAVGLVVSLKSEAAGQYYYLLPPLGACPNENTTNASQAASRQAMACLTNAVRQKANLRPLDYRLKMHSASYGKASNLMRCQNFVHSGRKPGSACVVQGGMYWENRSRVRCRAYGEILAWGNGYSGSPRNVMKAWLDSPGHRRLILAGGYNRAGTGVYRGTFRGYKGTSMWTQHFGYGCYEY